MSFIELGVMAFLGLVVLFLVIRPLVKRHPSPESIIAGALASGARAALPAAAPAATGTAVAVAAPSMSGMIDVAHVQGQLHAQSIQKIGELAEKNPNETASIIRQWLAEPAK